MENTSTLNVKKIALASAAVLAVVALGIYLGRGDGLKGSFVDPTKESALVPSPSDVKLAKDASGKFVLSWKYAAADLKKTNLETDLEDNNTPVASFEWEVEGPNGVLWGNGSNTENVYDPSTVETPDGHCYNPVRQISDKASYHSVFTCTSVYLDQKVVDAILDGESPVTLRVWADLGMTDGTVDDGFGGTTPKYIISMEGKGAYTLPVIPDPKAVDSVGLGDPKNPATLPTLIGWGWSDETYGPNEANSLFKDKDGYYFGFDWEILDVSDAAKPVSVFKKDIYGNPGTVPVEAGKDSKVETQKAIDANTKSFLVNDPTKKVWVAPFTYVPTEVKFEEGHSYIARVKTYNGKVEADKKTLVASATKDSPVYKRPISSVAVAPDKVDLAMNGDIAYRFTAMWNDSHYGPTVFNTKYTAGGKPVFAYEWSVVDTSDSNKVIFEKKITADPGTEYIKQYGKGTEDTPLKSYYQDMLDATGKTVKAWIFPKGYIDSTVKYLPEHTYEIRVKVDNGIGLTSSVATSKFTIPKVVPVDTTAPELVSATALSKNTVKVVFSEAVKFPNSVTVKDVFTIYQVQNGIATPMNSYNWALVTDSSGITVVLQTEDQKAGQKYQVAASALVTDLAGNVTKNPGAAVAFDSFVLPTAPMLDTIDIKFPAKEGELVTFTYGWDSVKKVQPDSTTTVLQDETGAYKFVYNVIVEEKDGSVLWNSWDSTKKTSPFLATPVTGYESCLSTIGGNKLWTCQTGYIPFNVPMIVGKEYTLRVAAYFSDSTNSGYLAKKFVLPKPGSVDTVAPEVVSATGVSFTEVKVAFSEAVKLPATAPESAFSVKDSAGTALTVKNVTGDSSGTTYILLIDKQSIGAKYLVTVNNTVKDVAGNSIDSILNRAEFSGYQPGFGVIIDTVAPQVVSAKSVTKNSVEVVFSEKVYVPIISKESTFTFTIRDTNGNMLKNYPYWGVVGPGFPGSVLGSTITLVTDDQKPNEKYSVIASNSIKDLSGNPVDTTLNVSEFTGYVPPVVTLTPVKPLDFVTINFSEGASGDNPVRFEYGWNETVAPSVTNTSLKNAKGEPVFAYGWYLYDAADLNGAPVWKKEKGEKFEDLSVLPPGCTSADSAECAPELVKIYAALYKSCFEKIDSASFAWTCAKGYIPSSVILDPKKNYVMKVLVYNGKDVTEKVASKAFTVAGPAVPAVIPPTMTLKNLSVKKLSDGNIAVTYTVDLAGKWTAEEFSSEVRLNGAKTFVARFTEKVKAGVLSYTYEAILLPWEIKSGDTVSLVMGANGLGAGSYLNDGQSVKYEASGTVATAVVGLVTANALPAATVGSPYSAAIVVKDGVAPYKYVLSSGSALPAGLSLDSLTGVLSGTPTSQGDYSFGLSITDSKNAALNATFTLKIVPAPVGGGTVSGGGTTIINNYTTYNPSAPVSGGSTVVVGGGTLKPVAPVIDSTKFVFPINLADVSRFRDTTYHWAKNYINVLWNAGYVQGYTVVTFGPDDSLTRAQLLKIVMESLRYKLPEKITFSPCTDVRPEHWHAKYFAVAREKGIIGGYTDGTCRPNKATNRAEALKILYGAIGKMPQIPAVVVTPTVPAGFRNIFVDVDEKSWYYPYFANAVSMGWLKGYEDSTIRPDDELSRAQMAKIVVLAMQKLSWVR